MSPLELKRLGQFLAGEIIVESDEAGHPVPPEQFTDAPRRTFPDRPGFETPEASTYSWVLVNVPGHHRNLRWVHLACGHLTSSTFGEDRTYAADPTFYTTLFCSGCQARFPVAECEVRCD